MGVFEMAPFARRFTRAVGEALTRVDGMSVVGGAILPPLCDCSGSMRI